MPKTAKERAVLIATCMHESPAFAGMGRRNLRFWGGKGGKWTAGDVVVFFATFGGRAKKWRMGANFPKFVVKYFGYWYYFYRFYRRTKQ